MGQSPSGDLTGPRVRVWDLPTRLVHWSIAALVPFSWWSAHAGHLPWHRLSGYTILGLVVFRLIWGVAGSSSARFTRFLRGPASVIAYVRGGGERLMGHNPLGGWSVAAMLGALLLQIGLGLFCVDEDGFEGGPLSKFLDFDTARAVAKIHHLTFYLLLALIVLHMGAIAFHGLRGRNLTGPMITGEAPAAPSGPAPRIAPAWRIAPAALAAAALAWLVAHGLRW